VGQKVSPIVLRIGFIKNWSSLWFASKYDFGKFITEDAKIRKFINVKFRQASISKIVIERVGAVRIKIHTARPGVIIGRHGAVMYRLKA
jgi:small subunit ribosomal protein S3